MVGLLVAIEMLLLLLRGTVVLLCENYWLRVCLSILPYFFNMFIIKFIKHITLITYWLHQAVPPLAAACLYQFMALSLALRLFRASHTQGFRLHSFSSP